MKKLVFAMLTIAVCAGRSGLAHAEETKKAKPLEVTGKRSMTATVKAVDPVARTLTVSGPKDTRTLPVDDRVTRFGQIKPGDRLSVQYYESVAFEIVKADPRAVQGADAQTVLTAVVWGVDPDTPAIKVRVGEQPQQNFRVRSKKYLKDLNMGDVVVVTLVDALIVAADPAK